MATTDYELASPLAVALHGSHATVRVTGDLDVISTSELAEALDVLAAQRMTRIDVDLRDVPHVDSLAVELLASTHARLCSRGGRLCIVGATHAIEELLRLRGVQGLLHRG